MTVKFDKLLTILQDMKSVVLAFSGGVDSTFLLKAVKESGIQSLAVTGYSETMPESELRFAEETAGSIGAAHMVIKTDEMLNPEFTGNPRNRCFHCKDELFSKLMNIADEKGFNRVIDGSNADDLSDRRPGRQAALKHGVRSPLIEAGFSKDEIRELSREMGLPTWSKPASPCLSSRFPYGIEITKDALKRVELSEEFLKSLGFNELRVRSYNDTAKIEVAADDIERLLGRELRESVINKLKDFGFKHVTIDLEGFRTGKLND
ncbi:MAG: TIGR00268 family protein [Nitrospirae bacterium GWB2_47_37]|nr:MAG: TIGR00268 family protein [Nitrospirae bacterium GWA2_46_11]OGW25650.1 MAG: TIGR00268 family protein [Nitrospirae bacterium GWB2_47_37]HAK88701.1 ATP-dependent sacrificial sulfur transferase LarE [Nitrospiraceae bacterium]